MLLQEKETGDLVEIMDVSVLINPSEQNVTMRSQHGEEEQDPEPIAKNALLFPSGEPLPHCWLDPHYRNA